MDNEKLEASLINSEANKLDEASKLSDSNNPGEANKSDELGEANADESDLPEYTLDTDLRGLLEDFFSRFFFRRGGVWHVREGSIPDELLEETLQSVLHLTNKNWERARIHPAYVAGFLDSKSKIYHHPTRNYSYLRIVSANFQVLHTILHRLGISPFYKVTEISSPKSDRHKSWTVSIGNKKYIASLFKQVKPYMLNSDLIKGFRNLGQRVSKLDKIAKEINQKMEKIQLELEEVKDDTK